MTLLDRWIDFNKRLNKKVYDFVTYIKRPFFYALNITLDTGGILFLLIFLIVEKSIIVWVIFIHIIIVLGSTIKERYEAFLNEIERH